MRATSRNPGLHPMTPGSANSSLGRCLDAPVPDFGSKDMAAHPSRIVLTISVPLTWEWERMLVVSLVGLAGLCQLLLRAGEPCESSQGQPATRGRSPVEGLQLVLSLGLR